MNEYQADTAKSGENSAKRQSEPRVPRSIRFSTSEWKSIEKDAKARGMTAAELVRYAATSLADGSIGPNSEAFPPEVPAQIEHIYRGVYLLSTLKRDDLIREGRQEDLERIAKAASESQASIRDAASRPRSGSQ